MIKDQNNKWHIMKFLKYIEFLLLQRQCRTNIYVQVLWDLSRKVISLNLCRWQYRAMVKKNIVAINCAGDVAVAGMATPDNAGDNEWYVGERSSVPRLMLMMSCLAELCKYSQMSVWRCRPQLQPQLPSVPQDHGNALIGKKCPLEKSHVAAHWLPISTQEGAV